MRAKFNFNQWAVAKHDAPKYDSHDLGMGVSLGEIGFGPPMRQRDWSLAMKLGSRSFAACGPHSGFCAGTG
jgi:hypothetical protein